VANKSGAPSGKCSQAAKVEQFGKRTYDFLTAEEIEALEKAAVAPLRVV
jgi:hypothetical protein